MNGSRLRWAFGVMIGALLFAGCAADAGDEQELLVDSIVRGHPDRGRDPGVVALLLGDTGLCTGTLIAPRVVLTARHCVSRLASEAVDCNAQGAQILGENPPESLRVVVGDEVSRGTVVAHGMRVLVPSSQRLCGADVAVVILDRAVEGIDPVPVDLTHAPQSDDEVIAIGFGRRGERAGAGIRERRDAVPILAVTPREIELGQSVCSGDSGGPALAANSGAVIGVVSRGTGRCSAANARNVYTRIDAWATLIREGLAAGGGAVPAASRTTMSHSAHALPSDLGAACASGGDCQSGYCVASTRTCTVTCDTESPCPSSHACVLASGGVRVCVAHPR